MSFFERACHGARMFVLASLAALVAAGCAQQPSYQVYNQPVARAGTIESIRQVQQGSSSPNGLGAIAGGLIGGGLGSLVGGGSGKTAAIIVGAVGGGLLGNAVAGHGSRTGGTLIGTGVGAVAGHEIARSRAKKRHCHYVYR